ncbi:hypothetical protein KKB55_13240 [Myxococcota bacterium]|nr:hypothetical protein [Myxococcota bacterium]MBU1898706.1 hypothetical protein [Myxococcota bacterium]
MRAPPALLSALLALPWACQEVPEASPDDAQSRDAQQPDAQQRDAQPPDAQWRDTQPPLEDSQTRDAALEDARASDAAPPPGPHAHCRLAALRPHEGATWSPAIALEPLRPTVTLYGDRLLRVTYGQPPPPLSRFWRDAPAPLAAPEGYWTTSDEAEGFELCGPEFSLIASAGGELDVEDRAGVNLLRDLPTNSGPSTGIEREAPAGEALYGFGEKTGGLNKRGARMTLYNTDAYDADWGGFRPDQDPLYLSIPWFIGLREGRAYGLFIHNTHQIELDMGAADPSRYTIHAAGGRLDQILILGPDMAQVIEGYTALTGRPPLPPRWALGYHQCRWGYANRAELEGVTETLRALDLPADAIWLDIQHLDGLRTFTVDAGAFPDFEAMLEGLKAQHFKTITIQDPGIKVDPGWPIYDQIIREGLAILDLDGAPWEGQAWPGASVFPDLSLDGGYQYWAAHIRGVIERGVDGIWLDVNEPTVFPESGGGVTLPDALPVAGRGTSTTLAEVHNVYALLQAQATYDGVRAARPDQRPFILSRAGWAGIQREAATWTGDASSTWVHLRGALPMLLNLGLSGVPFVGSDVGGYSGHATPALYARWMALGALSPFFRGHVTRGVPGQEPWAFGVEVTDISRAHMRLRYSLTPLMYTLMAEAEITGAPALRPMIYAFQEDERLLNVDDQAMLGAWMLAAPILEEGATGRRVILPEGRWFEHHSAALYEGPAVIEINATLAALPLFIRDGGIIPHIDPPQHLDGPLEGPLYLDVYPAHKRTAQRIYEDDGDGPPGPRDLSTYRWVTLRLEGDAAGATLSLGDIEGGWRPAPRRLIIRMRRVDAPPTAVRLDDAPIAAVEDITALGPPTWRYDARARALLIGLDDTGPFTLRADYDPTIREPIYTAEIALTARPPEGTPMDTPITVATSENGWTHQPLTWDEAEGVARGVITAPAGAWFEYKFARGGWCTVEKWPSCEEATNRYAFGAPGAREDQIWGWRDWCDEGPCEEN